MILPSISRHGRKSAQNERSVNMAFAGREFCERVGREQASDDQVRLPVQFNRYPSPFPWSGPLRVRPVFSFAGACALRRRTISAMTKNARARRGIAPRETLCSAFARRRGNSVALAGRDARRSNTGRD